MRLVALSLAALGAAATLVTGAGVASAACEPMPVLNPDFCPGDLPRIPPECWRDEHGIHCRF